MLRLDLARRLRDGGLTWTPERGDRFVVPNRDMDDEVMVVSDFTVEVHDVPSGTIIGFNGTTEWALDSLTLSQVLWLPREDQLRELLGTRFRRLEATDDGWTVVLAGDIGGERAFCDLDVESAYALAVLGGPR
jgi:hypothetical protein